jgi:hypothetical protein
MNRLRREVHGAPRALKLSYARGLFNFVQYCSIKVGDEGTTGFTGIIEGLEFEFDGIKLSFPLFVVSFESCESFFVRKLLFSQEKVNINTAIKPIIFFKSILSTIL